jgi:hypothetical protein
MHAISSQRSDLLHITCTLQALRKFAANHRMKIIAQTLPFITLFKDFLSKTDAVL